MKTHYTFGAVLIAVLLCLAGTPAWAADYSSVASGDWNDPATWGEAEDFPVAGDNVTINDGHTVTITEPAAAATLTILAGGGLAEAGTSTLVLSGELSNYGSIVRTRTTAWTVGQVGGGFANHGSYSHSNTGVLTIANGDFSQSGVWTSTHSNAAVSIPNGGFTLEADMTHAGAITVGVGNFTVPDSVTFDRASGTGNLTVSNGYFRNEGIWLSTGTGAINVPNGTFALMGAMTHIGAITVGRDGMNIGNDASLNRVGGTGNITVSSGSFVNFGDYQHTGSGNLTVSDGDFAQVGTWSSANSGATISVPKGTFTPATDLRHEGPITIGLGGLTIPAGLTFNRGAGTGTITLTVGNFINNGDYLHTGSGNLTVSDGNFIQSGNWSSTNSGAAISVASGTFTLAADMSHGGPVTIGIGGMTIPVGILYTHTGTGTVSITGGLAINGTLNRTGSGAFTIGTGNFVNSGIYSNSSTGSVTVSAGSFSQSGTWTSTNSSAGLSIPNGTFTLVASMSHAGPVAIGSGGMTIPVGISYTHTGTGTVSINGGLTVNGTLSRSGSGAFIVNTGSFVNNGGYANTSTGALTVTAGSFSHSGTWTSTSSGAITVPAGAFTFTAGMAQAGPVTIGVGGLTIPAGVTYAHTGTGLVSINGGLTNSGVLNRTGSGVFTINTGDFINNGSYSNLNTGDLNITGGSFVNAATGEVYTGTSTSQNHTIGGSFINEQDNPEKFEFQAKGTVTFTGSGMATVGSAAPLVFRGMTVNKPDGSLTMTSDLNVENGGLNIGAGRFEVGDNMLILGRSGSAGSVTVQPGGTFSVIGSDPDVGSRITALEPAANRAYAFTVNGTIAARNATFERMNASGVRITSTGMIAPAPYNFSYCTFDYGAANSPMLNIDRELTENIEIYHATFNDGTATARNIRKTAGGTGRVIVSKISGELWGEAYELDPDGPNPDGLIDWVQRDVAVTRIIAPAGQLDSSDVVTPMAVIRSFGTTAEEFPVYFTIGEDYADSVMITLAAGATDTVGFAEWAAIEPGMYEVVCWTALQGDMVPENDRLSDTIEIREPVYDAGVTELIAPAGLIEAGSVVVPSAKVRNFGSHPVTFPVMFRIGTDWADTLEVTLDPGAEQTVEFTEWTAEPDGWYVVACSTMFDRDQEPGNDILSDSVEVLTFVRDAAAVAILAPIDSVYYDSTVTPRAVVRSNSNIPVTFPVVFRIGAVYADTQQVTLAPGVEDTLSFSAWTAGPLGRFEVSCSTLLEDDSEPGNDAVRDTIEVVEGVGIAEGDDLPLTIEVSRVAPNPFVRLGSVRLALPVAERVSLKLYDAVGRQARVLADGPMPAGRHTLRVDAAGLAEGIYLLKAEIGEYNSTQKLVVQK